MTNRIEVLKPTQDSWYGSYKIDDQYDGVKNQMFVEVIFNGNIGTIADPMWRVCVWGNDDFGMEFDCDDAAKCWNKFLQVIGMKYVNINPLKELGFVSA